MSQPKRERLTLSFEQWPASHREMWVWGLSPDNLDEDDDPPAATKLSAFTLRNAARGWGRFLVSVGGAAEAHRLAAPAALVTPRAIRALVASLQAAGNSNSTITARLWEIRTALSIFTPGADFKWLTSPGGTDVRTLLCDPEPRRPGKPRSSKDLYEWGIWLMDSADLMTTPRHRARQFRNGLLIAMLAGRAPRLRATAALRLDQQITFVDEAVKVRFGRKDTKSRKPLEYVLPDRLRPYVSRYLTLERPVLLGDKRHLGFWVGQLGEPMLESGIERIIRRQSKRDWEREFGPHSFRHALGTSLPLAMPDKAAGAAALLGNSAAVAERYYNLGGQIEAAQAFQASIQAEREQAARLVEAAKAAKSAKVSRTDVQVEPEPSSDT